jgi:esterase/lipase
MKKITYTVDSKPEDDAGNETITIVGNYWQGTHDRAIVLLHMMSATKESWNECAEAFNREGYDVLAIDLRGHGESGGGNFKEFSPAEHQASRSDLEGAREWLITQGVHPDDIFIGGASIGSSLALQYLGEHLECKAVFCLSAGKNYRGIELIPIVRRLSADQRVLFVTARDDKRIPDNVDQVNEIYEATAAHKTFKTYETGGHGTEIFHAHPDLIREIIDWIA